MRRPNLAPYYRWLVLVTPVLVLLQAILAGQWLGGHQRYIDYHEIVANILVIIVIVQLILTVYLGIPGDLGKRLLVMNGLLVVLTLIQVGLGYSGRTDLDARAWHLPLGVFIFGLAAGIAANAPQTQRERE
ncbi:MAG TPA: hypothetical protein VFP05_12790 [Thermomicrobiales bacterium]|nr:hypothetical protein [Thermomicrobiales bacterium]